MPSAWIVEAVDVLEDGQFGVSARLPRPSPDQLGLDRLEERLDSCIVITTSNLEPLRRPLESALAAAIAVEDAALGRRSEGDGHFQRPDRQIAFHAIADGPTDHAAGMQIEDDRQI